MRRRLFGQQRAPVSQNEAFVDQKLPHLFAFALHVSKTTERLSSRSGGSDTVWHARRVVGSAHTMAKKRWVVPIAVGLSVLANLRWLLVLGIGDYRDVWQPLTGHAPNQFVFMLLAFPIAAYLTFFCFVGIDEGLRNLANVPPVLRGFRFLLPISAVLLALPLAWFTDIEQGRDLFELSPSVAHTALPVDRTVIAELAEEFQNTNADGQFTIKKAIASAWKGTQARTACPSVEDLIRTVPEEPIFENGHLSNQITYLQKIYAAPKDCSGLFNDRMRWLANLTQFIAITTALILMGTVGGAFILKQQLAGPTPKSLRQLALTLIVAVGAFAFWAPALDYNLGEIRYVAPEHEHKNVAWAGITAIVVLLALLTAILATKKSIPHAIVAAVPSVVGSVVAVVGGVNIFTLREQVGSGQTAFGAGVCLIFYGFMLGVGRYALKGGEESEFE